MVRVPLLLGSLYAFHGFGYLMKVKKLGSEGEWCTALYPHALEQWPLISFSSSHCDQARKETTDMEANEEGRQTK